MKCPQLSKQEATAAGNQNSIGDRMEKKKQAQSGGQFVPTTAKSDCKGSTGSSGLLPMVV